LVLSASKSHPFEPADEMNHEEGLESLSVLNLDQEFGVWLKRLDQLRE
jgi:hypothetical protein